MMVDYGFDDDGPVVSRREPAKAPAPAERAVPRPLGASQAAGKGGPDRLAPAVPAPKSETPDGDKDSTTQRLPADGLAADERVDQEVRDTYAANRAAEPSAPADDLELPEEVLSRPPSVLEDDLPDLPAAVGPAPPTEARRPALRAVPPPGAPEASQVEGKPSKPLAPVPEAKPARKPEGTVLIRPPTVGKNRPGMPVPPEKLAEPLIQVSPAAPAPVGTAARPIPSAPPQKRPLQANAPVPQVKVPPPAAAAPSLSLVAPAPPVSTAPSASAAPSAKAAAPAERSVPPAPVRAPAPVEAPVAPVVPAIAAAPAEAPRTEPAREERKPTDAPLTLEAVASVVRELDTRLGKMEEMLGEALDILQTIGGVGYEALANLLRDGHDYNGKLIVSALLRGDRNLLKRTFEERGPGNCEDILRGIVDNRETALRYVATAYGVSDFDFSDTGWLTKPVAPEYARGGIKTNSDLKAFLLGETPGEVGGVRLVQERATAVLRDPETALGIPAGTYAQFKSDLAAMRNKWLDQVIAIVKGES